MPKRRPPQEFIADITVSDDGLPVREAHDWTRDKLGILTSYCHGYAVACKSAGAFYFVDAMSGPGVCHIAETEERLLGSTLIALRTSPEFRKCLAIDIKATNARTLQARTQRFGERAVVLRGDANVDLVPAMLQHIPRRGPTLVLLDPEGVELLWSTVNGVAQHRVDSRKAELLILFATEGVNRMLPVEADIEHHNRSALDALFPPNSRWHDIWQRRRNGEITPADARALYVEEYRLGLKSLGYRHVKPREIKRPNGRLVYHLLFATDDDVGEKIMSDVFESMMPNRPQLKLL